MTGPLAGIRVADFTHFMAGPVSTLLLRDLGAEVIKIEPLHGEAGRLGGAYPVPNGEGLTFQVHNRGKMSMTVDLNTDEGKDVAYDMIRISDVVVENFRPGVIKQLGLGYEELTKINPTIIMASISGFGQSGPYSQWPAVDFVAQAMSGVMDLNGQPNDPPTKYGVEMGDYAGGIFGAFSIAAALYRRATTGQGEWIDIAMLDAMVFQLNYHPIRYKYADILYHRIGNRTAGSGISGAYKCKDGYVAIASGGDLRWKKMAEVLGRPDLANESRYATVSRRWENHDELDAIIREWAARRTVREAVEILHEHDQIVGPVHSLPQIFDDEHIKFRKMVLEVEHPIQGKVTVPGSVIKMRNAVPPPVESAAPMLAEHNGYALYDLLGYPNEKVRRLEEFEIVHPKESGAIQI